MFRFSYEDTMEIDVGSVKSKKKGKEKMRGPKKFRVGELLVRTASLKEETSHDDGSVGSIDTLSVTNGKLKLIAEQDFNNDSDGDNSSMYSGSRIFSMGSVRSHSLSAMSPGRGGSSADSWSVGSELSIQTRITNRELIEEIKKRAMKHRRPPEFVASLDCLDPSLISWDKKMPKIFNKEDPPINIIGCLHPLELVLAKADRRLRKRAKTLKVKQIKCDERTKEIDDAIKWKFSRAERYTAMLALKQLQVKWIRMILITKYLQNLKTRFEYKWKILNSIHSTSNCANVIQRAMKKWYRKNLQKKFQYLFSVSFYPIRDKVRYHLRIHRKRRAIEKLKKFLLEYKSNHKMSVVVHRYLIGVRKVQRAIRDFLMCKHAKVVSLEKVWEKLEWQYARKKFEQRKQHILELKSAKKSNDQRLLKLDNKAFIEMKQQAKTWAKIDTKMESMVSTLKAAGVIVEENEDEVIGRLLIPADIRYGTLKHIVERSRKEFYAGQRTMAKKLVDLDSTFKEHHAKELLRGATSNLERIINEKFNKRLVVLKYKPFLFFRTLDKKQIWDKIREIHYQRETFKIKVDKDADDPRKRKGKLTSKEDKAAAAANPPPPPTNGPSTTLPPVTGGSAKLASKK